MLAAWGAQPAAIPACTPPSGSGDYVSSLSLMFSHGETEDESAADVWEGSAHNSSAPAPRSEVKDGSCTVNDKHATLQSQASHASFLGAACEASEREARVGPLGASGEGMLAVQQALSALVDVHSTDDLMLRDYSCFVLLHTLSMHQVPPP